MNSKTPPKPDIPAEIRAEMARRGWSVRTLATHSGLNVTTLYRRLGDHGSLNMGELAAIAGAFGMTVSALIARAEDVAA